MGDLHHWFPIIPIQHDQYHDLDYHLRSTILRQIRLNKEYIQAYTYLYLPIFTIYLSFFLSLSIYNTNFQANSYWGNQGALLSQIQKNTFCACRYLRTCGLQEETNGILNLSQAERVVLSGNNNFQTITSAFFGTQNGGSTAGTL